MLKNLFSKKSQAQICLFLGMNKLSVCLLDAGKICLLQQVSISSDAQWEDNLKSIVSEHKLQNAQAAIVLSRDFYQTFTIEKPKAADNELMASLPFAIKDLVSESIFDLIVDYYDMPVQQHKGSQITAVCITKQRVIGIRDMLLKQSISIKEITIEELALTRLLGNSSEVNILLSQQNNELVLTVAKQGQLFFSHHLRGFNELLALPLDDIDNPLLDGLTLELQRALDYINSQLRITSIAHLYLAVVCPDLALLAEKLSADLGKNVVPFNGQENYDFANILAYSLLLTDKSQ